MKTIIGLSGYARTGKDTVADLLRERGFRRIAFADALRDALYALNPHIQVSPPTGGFEPLRDVIDNIGWEHAKTQAPEVRQLLQRLGTEVGREQFGQNFWVNLTFLKIMGSTHDHWVIPDCRFPNEHKAVKDNGGIMFRIIRPDFGPANDHISEVAIDDHQFDSYLLNDAGIAELREELDNHLYAHGIDAPVPVKS